MCVFKFNIDGTLNKLIPFLFKDDLLLLYPILRKYINNPPKAHKNYTIN